MLEVLVVITPVLQKGPESSEPLAPPQGLEPWTYGLIPLYSGTDLTNKLS